LFNCLYELFRVKAALSFTSTVSNKNNIYKNRLSPRILLTKYPVYLD